MSLYACLKICGFQFDQILFVCFSTSFLRIALVENIPEGLNYSENAPFHLSLFQGWMNLLNMAKKSVDIVSSHWDLNHSHPSACQVSCILCVCVSDFSCLHCILFPIRASMPQVQSHFLSLSVPIVHVHYYIYMYVMLIRDCSASPRRGGFQGQNPTSSCTQKALLYRVTLGTSSHGRVH